MCFTRILADISADSLNRLELILVFGCLIVVKALSESFNFVLLSKLFTEYCPGDFVGLFAGRLMGDSGAEDSEQWANV